MVQAQKAGRFLQQLLTGAFVPPHTFCAAVSHLQQYFKPANWRLSLLSLYQVFVDPVLEADINPTPDHRSKPSPSPVVSDVPPPDHSTNIASLLKLPTHIGVKGARKLMQFHQCNEIHWKPYRDGHCIIKFIVYITIIIVFTTFM